MYAEAANSPQTAANSPQAAANSPQTAANSPQTAANSPRRVLLTWRASSALLPWTAGGWRSGVPARWT
eukprot:716196-Pyramimonas_sp.AAC.1